VISFLLFASCLLAACASYLVLKTINGAEITETHYQEFIFD